VRTLARVVQFRGVRINPSQIVDDDQQAPGTGYLLYIPRRNLTNSSYPGSDSRRLEIKMGAGESRLDTSTFLKGGAGGVGFHVLQVAEGSPAAEAGIEAFFGESVALD
jgi:hypothetical protein